MNNGRRHSKAVRSKTRVLRKRGLTHREIAKELNISLGSASLWTRGIRVTAAQKDAIESRRNRTSPHYGTNERRVQALKYLSRFWKPTPDDGELLKRITAFYDQHQRIPLKREFNSTYLEYKNRFGSWNKAIRLAGFKPNEVIFSRKFAAADGHICDSFAEKIIDNWLNDHGIGHQRNWQYEGTKFTADFFIKPNILIEFFGLAGVSRSYDKNIKSKCSLSKRLGLDLIELYPRDIFPVDKLDKKLGMVITKVSSIERAETLKTRRRYEQ